VNIGQVNLGHIYADSDDDEVDDEDDADSDADEVDDEDDVDSDDG
jgi:hypothetical protein